MTQTDHLRQIVHQKVVPTMNKTKTLETQSTLRHTTVFETSYLLSRAPTDIPTAVQY